jgi:DNA-binding MarR family transcriptional regulator
MGSDFQLENSLTFWVSRLAGLMQESFNRDLDVLDVTWAQWLVMNLLAQESANTPAVIAQKIGVDRSAITRLVDRLEKKGMVLRRPATNDRRSVEVMLTDSGARLVSHLNDTAEQHHQRMVSSLSDEDQLSFRLLINRVLKSQGVSDLRVANN